MQETVCAPQLWASLVEREVLSKVHEFAEVDAATVPAPRCSTIPQQVHRGSAKEIATKINLKNIIGYSLQPPWNSPGASMLSAPWGDIELVQRCKAAGDLEAAQNGWLCCLLRGTNLLVNRHGTDSWFFSLGDCCSAIGLGWPAEKCTWPGDGEEGFYFVPRAAPGTAFEYLPVTKLGEWYCLEYDWQSPMRQVAQHMYYVGLTGQAASVKAVPRTTTSSTLLQVAANNAFWSLPTALLQQIGRHLGLDIKGTLFQTLKQLLTHILHSVTDERICQIMKLRVVRGPRAHPLVAELLDMDETIECLDEEEQREVRQEQKAYKRAAQNADLFESEFKAFHAKTLGLKKTRASGNPKNAKSPLHRVRTLATVPPGAITQQEAKQMLPPGAYVWQGNYDGCWCVQLKPYPRFSKSWTLMGHRGALMECLRYVRRLWLSDNFLTESDCPVKNLFTVAREAVAVEPAAASSSSGQAP